MELANLKRLVKAEESIRHGIELDPDNPTGYVYLGDIYSEQGKTEKARKYYKKAIARKKNYEQPYLKMASGYLKEKDYNNAERVYKQILENVNPYSRDAAVQLMQLYAQDKKFDKAITVLEKALEHNPRDFDLLFKLSYLFKEIKDYPKAIQKAVIVVAARPKDIRMHAYLGYLYEEAGKYDSAEKEYLKVIEGDPSDIDAHIHLGFVLAKRGEKESAIVYLKKAIELDPKRPNAYLILGMLYSQEKRLSDAKDLYLSAIESMPDSPDMHFNLGIVYDKLDMFDDMVRELDTSIELDPEHDNALNYLGYSYADRGIKLDAAVELITKALGRNPDNGAYVDSLGWAYYKKGLIEPAFEQLKRASQLMPDDPPILEHLGDVYLEKNMRSEARSEWIKALELDIENEKLINKFIKTGFGEPGEEERLKIKYEEYIKKKSLQHPESESPVSQ